MSGSRFDVDIVSIQERVETALSLVAKLQGGSIPAALPWGDPAFQHAVIKALVKTGELSTAAQEFVTFKRHLRDVVGPKE